MYAAENDQFYAFKVGQFNCTAVSDGYHTYQLAELFANVAAAQLAVALDESAAASGRLTTPYTCLVIDTGQHHLLVDVGAGSILPAAGRLARNMEAAGLPAPVVDRVILTHAHPDHIGGLLDETNRPVFVNATYFVSRSEHEFWFSATAFARAPAFFVDLARRCLLAVEDRLTLVDVGEEILEGIRVVAAAGHTPGHIALDIASGEERLLHVSDAALTPLHLEYPCWWPTFDVDPAEAVASKKRLFAQAAAEGTLLFAHHFPPFPGLGYVIAAAAGWKWQPIHGGKPGR